MSLINALLTRRVGQNTLPDELNGLVPALVTRFNSEIAPRLLSRRPDEPVPTDARSQASFRSRVSLLIEYSFIEMLADFLREDAPGLFVTYNVTNQFADFFVRDQNWHIQLRVDVKTLHDLSEEASARFKEPLSALRELDDYLLYVSWKWERVVHRQVSVDVPWVLGAVFVPAVEVARERDLRQRMVGGTIDSEGRAYAASGAIDTNFGKVDRLVHANRRQAMDLSHRVVDLLQLVYEAQANARSGYAADVPSDRCGVVTAATDEA